MNETLDLKSQIVKTYSDLLASIVQATPRVVAGIFLVVLALVAAKVIERLLRTLLNRVQLDALIVRVGLDESLRKLGITQAPHYLIPRVVYFLLLFLFAQTTAEALGLSAISGAIGSFLGFLPNIVAAILLVLFGGLAAQFAGAAASRAAKQAGIDYAGTLGSVVGALILFVVGVMAVSQLEIQTEIIRIVTVCTLAGLALAFGISFGLGTREITRHIVAGFYARKLFRVGAEIEVRGERGVLEAITPTQILVRQDDRTVAIANGTLMDEFVKQP